MRDFFYLETLIVVLGSSIIYYLEKEQIVNTRKSNFHYKRVSLLPITGLLTGVLLKRRIYLESDLKNSVQILLIKVAGKYEPKNNLMRLQSFFYR